MSRLKMDSKSQTMLMKDIEQESTLIHAHREWLKEEEKYTVTRLCWDVYHGIVKYETKLSIRKQSLNDKHIENAVKKVLKYYDLF